MAKIFLAPAFFGEIESLAGLPCVASVSTLLPCRLLSVPISLFSRLIEEHGPFAIAAVKDIARRFCLAGSNERDFAFHQVTPRLARLLTEYNAAFAISNEVPIITLSQVAMANDLGVTRKAVVGALRSLTSQGLIRRVKAGYIIVDFRRMSSLVQGLLPLVHSTR